MKHYFPLLALLSLMSLAQHALGQTPQWRYLGDTIVEETWASGALPSLAGDLPAVAYLVFDNNDLTWRVRQFDGNEWVAKDTTGLANRNYQALSQSADGSLQMAYYDSEKQVCGIVRLTGNTWQIITESPQLLTTPYYISYAFDQDRLLIAFDDDQMDNRLTVWEYNGNTWSVLGQSGFSDGRASAIILKISNGLPWVMYEDWSLGNAGIVQKWDSGTWQTVGNQAFNGADPHDQKDFTVADGVPYIAYADSSSQSRASVLRFDGAQWSSVGMPMFTSPTSFVKLAVDEESQKPYLIFEDYDQNFWGVSALGFNGTGWEYVGQRGFISNQWNMEFAIKHGVPYVGYERGPFGGGASFQVFHTASAAPEPAALGFRAQIQPNPIANGTMQIRVDAHAESEALAQVFDAAGRLVHTQHIRWQAGTSMHPVSVGTWPRGEYHLRIQSGKTGITCNFVVAQ